MVPITVPPLRTRREDIRGLVRPFLQQSSHNDPPRPLSMADDAIAALAAHDWPGNVRELRNVLERAIYLARAAGENELKMMALPASGSGERGEMHGFQPGRSYRDTRNRFESDFEQRYVKWLLARHNGNISAAAREAQMDRKYLYDLAKKHGMRARRAHTTGTDAGSRCFLLGSPRCARSSSERLKSLCLRSRLSPGWPR